MLTNDMMADIEKRDESTQLTLWQQVPKQGGGGGLNMPRKKETKTAKNKTNLVHIKYSNSYTQVAK